MSDGMQSYENFGPANFVKFGVKFYSKGGSLPQIGGVSPFFLTLLDTTSESLLTCKKFWGSAPKNGGKCPPEIFKPQNLKN